MSVSEYSGEGSTTSLQSGLGKMLQKCCIHFFLCKDDLWYKKNLFCRRPRFWCLLLSGSSGGRQVPSVVLKLSQCSSKKPLHLVNYIFDWCPVLLSQSRPFWLEPKSWRGCSGSSSYLNLKKRNKQNVEQSCNKCISPFKWSSQRAKENTFLWIKLAEHFLHFLQHCRCRNFYYSTFKIQESTFFVFFCGEPCPITLPVRTDKAKNDSSS